MFIWRNFSLRTKINLILLLVLAVFLTIGLYWQYRQQRALFFAEAVDKAKIITAEATRTREYLSRQLKTGQVELNGDRYGLIPVVVANRVGQLVAEDLTYTIRHISARVRNRDNAPDSYEQAVLGRFAADPGLRQVAEFTVLDGASVFRFVQAAPADESCLECHGDPLRAPSFLREIYPPEQDPSYGYRPGEVIGAVSVVIPMAQIESRLMAGFQGTLLTTSGFFLALVACLGLFLGRTVLNPLQALVAAIGRIRKTGEFDERLPIPAQDEIGELVGGFNAMMDEIGARTAQLEESEKRFRLLTETARDAIVAFLPTGQIFLFNRQAERIFGYTQNELLGEPFDRLFVAEHAAAGPELTAAIVAADPPWFRKIHLLTGLRRDRSQVRLELSVTRVDTGERPFYTAMLREASTDA